MSDVKWFYFLHAGGHNVKDMVLESKHLIAVCFGALDFTGDMGSSLSKDGSKIFYARLKMSLVANPNNVLTIDTRWFDLIEEEGSRAPETSRIRHYPG